MYRVQRRKTALKKLMRIEDDPENQGQILSTQKKGGPSRTIEK
jgi:hypothetical protein